MGEKETGRVKERDRRRERDRRSQRERERERERKRRQHTKNDREKGISEKREGTDICDDESGGKKRQNLLPAASP